MKGQGVNMMKTTGKKDAKYTKLADVRVGYVLHDAVDVASTVSASPNASARRPKSRRMRITPARGS